MNRPYIAFNENEAKIVARALYIACISFNANGTKFHEKGDFAKAEMQDKLFEETSKVLEMITDFSTKEFLSQCGI